VLQRRTARIGALFRRSTEGGACRAGVVSFGWQVTSLDVGRTVVCRGAGRLGQPGIGTGSASLGGATDAPVGAADKPPGRRAAVGCDRLGNGGACRRLELCRRAAVRLLAQ